MVEGGRTGPGNNPNNGPNNPWGPEILEAFRKQAEDIYKEDEKMAKKFHVSMEEAHRLLVSSVHRTYKQSAKDMSDYLSDMNKSLEDQTKKRADTAGAMFDVHVQAAKKATMDLLDLNQQLTGSYSRSFAMMDMQRAQAAKNVSSLHEIHKSALTAQQQYQQAYEKQSMSGLQSVLSKTEEYKKNVLSTKQLALQAAVRSAGVSDVYNSLHTQSDVRGDDKNSFTTQQMMTALVAKMIGKTGALAKAKNMHDKIVKDLNAEDHPIAGHLDAAQRLASNFDAKDLAKMVGGKSVEPIVGGVSATAVKAVAASFGELATAAAAAAGPLGAILTEAAGAATLAAPWLVLGGLIVAALTAIVKEMWDFQVLKAKWAGEIGGDIKAIEAMNQRLLNNAKVTGKSAEQLYGLAKAFEHAGLQAIEGGKDVDNYMIMATNMNKVLQLSDDQWASNIRAQDMAGKTAQETHDTYDLLYQDMQKMGVTLKELAGIMEEGEQLWRAYGSTGGSALAQVQDDLIKTSGLFKGLNIDAKNAAQSLADLADPTKRRSIAAGMGSVLGMDSRKLLNLATTNPEEFERLRVKEAATLLNTSGTRRDLTREQLSQLPQAQQEEIIRQQDLSKIRTSRFTKESPAVVEGVGNALNAFFQNPANKGKSIDDFMDSYAPKGKVRGSVDEAQRQIDKTGAGQAESIGNKIFSEVKSIGDRLVPALDGLLAFFHIPAVTNDNPPGAGGPPPPPPPPGGGGLGMPQQIKDAAWDAEVNKYNHRNDQAQAAALGKTIGQGIVNSPAGQLIRGSRNLMRAASAHPAAAAHMLQSAGMDALGMVSPAVGLAEHAAGWLSSSFEGNIGSVAPGYRTKAKAGDIAVRKGIWRRPGTAAYGAFQMDSEFGGPAGFVNFLKSHNPAMYAQLAPYVGDIGNDKGQFAHAWKGIAASMPDQFKQMQTEYNLPKYLNPMLKAFPGLANSSILKEVAFSTAVQHGTGGAQSLFKNAGYGKISDSQFLHNLYAARSNIMPGSRYSREEALAQSELPKDPSMAHGPVVEELKKIHGELVDANKTHKAAHQDQIKKGLMPAHAVASAEFLKTNTY